MDNITEKYFGEILNRKQGDSIAREGAPSQGFYILISGKVGVYKNKIKIAEFTEQGTVMGEIGMILNKPRTASLIAMESTSVLNVKTDIDELIIKFPGITANLMYNLADRLYNTTDNYVTSIKLLEEEFALLYPGDKNEGI
ncbi:MAG: cyclic nucleotide-binding domain-containing protein [Ignavibacteria bacterium]